MTASQAALSISGNPIRYGRFRVIVSATKGPIVSILKQELNNMPCVNYAERPPGYLVCLFSTLYTTVSFRDKKFQQTDSNSQCLPFHTHTHSSLSLRR